jgi:hypothetical protein
MNAPKESLAVVEKEYNKVLNDYTAYTTQVQANIKAILRRILDSQEVTNLLSTSHIESFKKRLDSINLMTFREFYGELNRELSSAKMTKIADEQRNKHK